VLLKDLANMTVDQPIEPRRQPPLKALCAAGFWISMALVLTACAGTRVEPLMPTPVIFTELDVGPLDHIPEGQRWKPRRVYYATTRARESSLQRIDYSNAESDRVSVGMALIGFGGSQISWSDLNDYSRREERPETVDLSIAGLVEAGYFRHDDQGRIEDVSGAAAWLMTDLNNAIESARDRDLMIYVHGAKVNFYNANAFAAQLDHFMGRDMTSMAFSWPTRQNIFAYGTGGDVRRAYRAAPSLATLLELLAEESVARRIHVVCWSAGGRVVTEALRQLHERHADAPETLRLGTVYFAAADVPEEEFIAALPGMNALANRVVVTSSSRDDALRMAGIFMGGGTRIGQHNRDLSEEDLDVVLSADSLEVVDVSYDWEQRGFDITGHRYWFNHPWASSDLILAVRSDLAPEDRALQSTNVKVLWGVPPDYPARLRESLTREDLIIRE
jgi:esterase/lipase superfamily enzyme